MGKTTCPQRQRAFFRCLPICFGGAANLGPNSEWHAGRFFAIFIFCHWNGPVWESLYGVIKQIQLGHVPLRTALVAPALPASLIVPYCVSGGCLFVLERLSWGTNASPGASQVGGDGKPELPGVAALPHRWLSLVWTAAPVCFLRGKLSLRNH